MLLSDHLGFTRVLNPVLRIAFLQPLAKETQRKTWTTPSSSSPSKNTSGSTQPTHESPSLTKPEVILNIKKTRMRAFGVSAQVLYPKKSFHAPPPFDVEFGGSLDNRYTMVSPDAERRLRLIRLWTHFQNAGDKLVKVCLQLLTMLFARSKSRQTEVGNT